MSVSSFNNINYYAHKQNVQRSEKAQVKVYDIYNHHQSWRTQNPTEQQNTRMKLLLVIMAGGGVTVRTIQLLQFFRFSCCDHFNVLVHFRHCFFHCRGGERGAVEEEGGERRSSGGCRGVRGEQWRRKGVRGEQWRRNVRL